MRSIIIPIVLAIIPLTQAGGQQTGEKIQREVRLYNPFRPTLSEASKKNFFPDMTDTTTIMQEFTYSVTPEAFTPSYTVSTIRPAALLPDPLPKLYKSYLNLGIGNYFTPVGELSISNERSRKGMIGFYARHFSSNGKLQLDNFKKVYAGYMDNDAAFYGKKFYRNTVLSGSVDFAQMTRYAYGYDTLKTTWEAEREDIKLSFIETGASASISSLRTDSGSLVYDFSTEYGYFRQSPDLWQHDLSVSIDAGRSIKALSPRRTRRSGVSDFYGRLQGSYDITLFGEAIDNKPRHIVTLNPTLGKKSNEWNFNLGFIAASESRTLFSPGSSEYDTRIHVYPDVSLSIAVIPSFLIFNLALEGGLSENSATETVRVNPFIQTDGSLYRISYTDNEIIARAGFSGSVIPDMTYRVAGSYTVFKDMLFFSNIVWDDILFAESVGNFFMPVLSDGNLANIHGEINTSLSSRITAIIKGGYYHYDLTGVDFPYNMPSWDGYVQLKYNLRNKIIAGAAMNLTGSRSAHITMKTIGGPMVPPRRVELPSHFNLNLMGEYRYTNILSFWVRLNNIGFNRNYEWAFYPSQRFLVLAGFSYSL